MENSTGDKGEQKKELDFASCNDSDDFVEKILALSLTEQGIDIYSDSVSCDEVMMAFDNDAFFRNLNKSLKNVHDTRMDLRWYGDKRYAILERILNRSCRSAPQASYKWDTMPPNTWGGRKTPDDIRVDLNSEWQWAFTCRNQLCESGLYKEAVDKYFNFLTSLTSQFVGVGKPMWWFRGQSDISWPLQPGALRPDVTQSIYLQLPINLHGKGYTRKQLYYEKMLMSTFIRNGSGLITERLSNEEWYVRAQHHGMPTRLLDWTLNPQIALWMALSDVASSGKDGVIVAMLPIAKDDKKSIVEKWGEERKTKLLDWLSTNPESEKLDSEMEEYCQDEAIITYAPNNYTDRQSQQQSCFTLHTPASKTSELVTNVGVNEFYECQEFVVEAKYKEFYKTFLYMLGMRRWNIYPDLDNLARGIREGLVVVPGNNVVLPPTCVF